MCVIIYMPKGKNITKKELQDAWNRNDDGASITYLKNNEIHVKKGYMNFNEFYNDCKKLIFDDTLERILHFRLTSTGATKLEQTHPYPISQNIRDLNNLDYTTTTPVAMMNGTIFSIEPEEGLNDTMTYIKYYLYQYKDEISSLMNILNEGWPRWAVITSEKVFLTDNFLEENGIYYSNFHHRQDPYEWN